MATSCLQYFFTCLVSSSFPLLNKCESDVFGMFQNVLIRVRASPGHIPLDTSM